MTSRRVRVWAAGLAGVVLLLAGDASRARPPVCLPDFPDLVAKEIVIPLGCELIDCCPRCPLRGSLDLRVRVSGEAVVGGALRIRASDGAVGDTIKVPRDEAIQVPAVASPRGAYPPPVASLRLVPDRLALARAAEPGGAADLGGVTVQVEQLLGDIVVNEFMAHWDLLQCADLEPCDRIVQVGNRGGDDSVILLDARRKPAPGACTQDEIRRSTGTDVVGNLIGNDGCPSEVAIFSGQDAMAIEEEVGIWKNTCGDELSVALDPILVAPVTFFLAVPDLFAQLSWGKSVDVVATEDFANASQIYDENKTGISFSLDMRKLTSTQLVEVAGLLPGVLLGAIQYGFDPLTFVCGATKDLEDHGYYIPDRLNVYYLPVPGGGLICPDNRNIMFIAAGKKPATVAHELSHAFSLLGTWGHTNGVDGFDNHNVMWVRESAVRAHFSLGQAFRQNLEKASKLNENQVRLGPERVCPLDFESDECPYLGLDWPRP